MTKRRIATHEECLKSFTYALKREVIRLSLGRRRNPREIAWCVSTLGRIGSSLVIDHKRANQLIQRTPSGAADRQRRGAHGGCI